MSATATYRTPPPTDRLVTGEELLAHPEWGKCDLIKGRVIPVCRPSIAHGILAGELSRRLGNHAAAKKLGRVFVESGVYIERNPDTVRGPDIGYYKADRLSNLKSNNYLDAPPDLCVEIVSSNDTWSDLNDKVESFLAAGVPLVWVIDPQRKKAHVFTKDSAKRVLGPNETLSGEDVLPGFSVALAELFSVLE